MIMAVWSKYRFNINNNNNASLFSLKSMVLLLFLLIIATIINPTHGSKEQKIIDIVPETTTTTTNTKKIYRIALKAQPCPVKQSDSIEKLNEQMTQEYIDSVVTEVTGFSSVTPIMRPYHPHRYSLWKAWHGTLFQHGVYKSIFNMFITAILSHFIFIVAGDYQAFAATTTDPAIYNPWILRLKTFDKFWNYCRTLTTFVLTFFMTQAFTFWREMYNTARKVQGSINDLFLILSTHTLRENNKKKNSYSTTQYTKKGRKFLESITQILRLIPIFVWASYSRRYRVLLTNRGMQKLVDCGFMKQEQMDTLISLDIPRNNYHFACIEWAMIEIQQAQSAGLLSNSQTVHMYITEKACQLRGAIGAIKNSMNGRMPLVYAHFVQVLVDFFLFGAPFALYTELGKMAIACVGMLTLFYEGLLDLAKVFLDPLENEDYCDGGIEMDLGVLIRETNAASISFQNGASNVPM